jgi:DNA (cytosine-5)-methyltransferase 1
VVEPTVISTFAGCGGSSLGYRLAGFKELLAVEWDDNAVATEAADEAGDGEGSIRRNKRAG